jgi:ABC-2 type transport system permease protein
VRQVLGYTVMLIRAFARDFTGLFFSLFLPLGFMLIFGSLNFGAATRVDLGVVDEARNPVSASLRGELQKIETFNITDGSLDEMRAQLEAGDLDMVLVIPAGFRVGDPSQGGAQSLTVLAHGARGQEVGIGTAILGQVVTGMSFGSLGIAPPVTLRTETVAARDLGYVDFLMPGIVGMNVMQLAIFSVGFGLVIEKQRGVLRRIMATPLAPVRFFASHVLMRLLIAFVQVLILVGVAVVLFKVTIVGSMLTFLALTALGSVMFLTFGFALAGWATSDNQVAPVSNLITLPQLFLSGVFFPRESAPEFIRPATDLLPLTFLNDALREVSLEGATLWDVRGDALGMAVWTLIGFVVAVRLFRFQT